MNSTRRGWQTTGSQAPGATLGLRRRAAAMAPTNPATLRVRACACFLTCVHYVEHVDGAGGWALKWKNVGRRNTQDMEKREEKEDWWIGWCVCIYHVWACLQCLWAWSMCLFAFTLDIHRDTGWEGRTCIGWNCKWFHTVRTDPHGNETYEIWTTPLTAARCVTQVLVWEGKSLIVNLIIPDMAHYVSYKNKWH